MLKKAVFVIAALLLAGGLGWAGMAGTAVQAGNTEDGCPPGYVESVVLAPIQPGEQGSEVVDHNCRPADEEVEAVVVEAVVLEPMSPEELERPAYQPTETSPIVRGPSDSDEYRCVVVLKPLEEGGGASEPVCGSGRIELVDGVSLESLYLIAKFYDNTDYGSLLKEYYGQYPCSAGYSYGRPNLHVDGVDNQFASGQGFSSCDRITVYDWHNYTGAEYSCGPNCPIFHALNDEVSAWKIED